VPGDLEGVVRLVVHDLDLGFIDDAVVVAAGRQENVEPEGHLPGHLIAALGIFLIVGIEVVRRVDTTTASELANTSAASPEVRMGRRRRCRRVLTRSRQQGGRE